MRFCTTKGSCSTRSLKTGFLAETSKNEASRALLEELKAKKQALAKLLLQTTAASPKDANERIQALEQEVEGIQDKLARQFTDVGQARRALAITVEQVQAAIPKNAVLIEYVRYQLPANPKPARASWGYAAVSLRLERRTC